MIGPGIIREKGAEFLARSRALRLARFGDPVVRTYPAQAIRSGQVRADLGNWLRVELAAFRTTRSIYTLTTNTAEAAGRLRGAFQAARARQGARPKHERDFSAPEDNEDVQDGGMCLYVGGSLTRTVHVRLGQHLDRVQNGTYALNMRWWVPEDWNGAVTVSVCAILGDRDDTLANDIEDALWQSRQPIFGRLGR